MHITLQKGTVYNTYRSSVPLPRHTTKGPNCFCRYTWTGTYFNLQVVTETFIKLHNEEFHNLDSSPNMSKVIIWRCMRWRNI